MRIRWIDIAKGIGILLVTMGHTRLSGTALGPWITSFHMPLFFIIAGMCFDERRYNTLGAYARRKVIALLYPYVGLSIFVITLFSVLSFDRTETFSASTLLGNMFRGDTIGPFWFIPVLLWVELAYGVLAKIVSSIYGRLSFCLCCYVIGIDLTRTGVHEFFINTVFVSMLYYGIGCAISRFKEKDVGSMKMICIGMILTVIHIVSLLTVFPYYAEYVNCKFGNPITAVFVAVVGSSAVFAFSKVIDKSTFAVLSKIFAWMGRHSIVLFVMHGVCGACRSTWNLGLWGFVCEYLLLAVVTFLLVGPLNFFVSPQK